MRQTAVAAFRWLAEYRTEWVRPDLVAGLTLAAYLLPAGIGDASLAGLASRGGSLRLSVFRDRLLALLQLEAHRHHRHVGVVAPDRRVGR